MIKSDLNGSLLYNRDIGQKELVFSQEKPNEGQAKSRHDSDGVDTEVVSVALQEVRDVSNSPMLVISQDPLVNHPRHDLENHVIELTEYNPVIEERDPGGAGIVDDTEAAESTNNVYGNFDSDEVKSKSNLKSVRGRPLSNNSLKLQKFMDSSAMLLGDVLDSESLTGLDLRCGVCGGVLEEDKLETYFDLTKELEPNQDLQQSEPLSKVLENIIGKDLNNIIESKC